MMNAILDFVRYNQLQPIVSTNHVDNVRRVDINILPIDILLHIGIIILSLILLVLE